jgi:hypothetical protein
MQEGGNRQWVNINAAGMSIVNAGKRKGTVIARTSAVVVKKKSIIIVKWNRDGMVAPGSLREVAGIYRSLFS